MNNIAIVIPTINRPHFVKRALAFYNKSRFTGRIYVGDSSINKDTEIVVKSFINLNCIYHRNPQTIHDGNMIQELNEFIDDKDINYVAYAGDDDFLIPTGLNQCAKFLDKNHEYVAAHGHRINFTYQDNKPIVSNCSFGYNWDTKTTKQGRWLDYVHVGIAMANYLHRKDIWVEKYKYEHKTPSRYLGPEFLPESITALAGPVKYLDNCITYMFYQNNPERVFSFANHDLYDLMLTPAWVKSLQTVTEVVSQHLGVDLTKQYLWRHFVGILLGQYQNKYGAGEYELKTVTIKNPDYGKINEILKTIQEVM